MRTHLASSQTAGVDAGHGTTGLHVSQNVCLVAHVPQDGGGSAVILGI